MVVLCVSSAKNYIEDIRHLGYEPVILEPIIGQQIRELLDDIYANLKGGCPEIFYEKESYEDTLAMVREIAPCVIIPGTDFVLELATRLAYDLGLPGNNPAQLPYLREKDKMQEAIKDAGLRYIRGKVVTTIDEAVAYYRDELNGKPAIVKPLKGAGSNGVIACMDETELIKAVVDDIAMDGNDGTANASVLVQEMIIGTEYFVDTVTRDGQTVVTNVMRYIKKKLNAERPVYICSVAVDSTEPIYKTLADYVIKVVDAVGLTVGPSHTEVMVDEEGPVLIEVNARLAGGEQPAEWQSMVLGLHESDIALRAYLGMDILHDSCGVTSAEYDNDGGYGYFRRRCPGYIHQAFTPNDLDVIEFVGKEMFDSLPSVQSWNGFKSHRHYPATIDFLTEIGVVFMANPSEEDLERDFRVLTDIEMNHIEKLFRIK